MNKIYKLLRDVNVRYFVIFMLICLVVSIVFYLVTGSLYPGLLFTSLILLSITIGFILNKFEEFLIKLGNKYKEK